MTTPDTEARTALQELLDERQRYQGWLRALEQRRTATPAHVYERVHTDYTLRLERVMQRLRERAEQLTSTIEGMQSRLQTLRSREADRTDERNEYELRAAVGELSPDDWERRRDEADRELTAIADDRRQIESELAELQRIVALTREQPEPPVPPAAEQPEAQAPQRAPEPAPAPARPEPQERAPTPAAQPSPWSAPPAERTAFHATTPAASSPASASGNSGAPSTAGEHPLAANPAGESPSIDDFIAEWPLRQMGGEGPSTAPATATWHPPEQRAAETSSAQPTSAPGSTPAQEGGHDVHQHHVGEGRRDMDKTLKCPECGAMNYATEWYCERCGGELASF